nr:reverse transcriptase [Hymenolepis microstoma]
MYKDTPLEQTSKSTYLEVTFDTKRKRKNHIAKIAERASNRLDVLKRIAGSIWGSARSILNTTYKLYVRPIVLYCCETLVTLSEAILKPIERTHNQALRLIAGGIKSTPIDAMLLVTGNSTIRSSVEETVLILYEKLLRIPSDTFWSSYENRPRHLKTQVGLMQKSMELKKRLQTTDKPERLPLPQNTLADNEVQFCFQLIGHFMKADQIRLLALETINANYPADQWLQVFTGGSYVENQANVGAGIYSELFTFFAAAGQNRSVFEGEIETIKIASGQLCSQDTKFTNAVILSDSKSAIQSIGSKEPPKTAEIHECKTVSATQRIKQNNSSSMDPWTLWHYRQ